MRDRLIKFLRRPMVIRLISLGDQGMFAVGNFLLTILLTRYYDDIAMAAYGIALSLSLVLQGVQRNSYLIQNALLNSKIFKSRGPKILGEHIIAIFPIFMVLILLSVVVLVMGEHNLFCYTIIATTACFSIYAQLEFERILLIKYEKNLIPFFMSFLFIVICAALFFLHEYLSFYDVLGILLVYACIKTLTLFYVVKKIDIRGGFVLLRSDFRRNSLASLMGVIGSSGYTHGPVLALGMLSTPTQAAAFLALRGLLQPVQIIMRSMDIIDKNFFHAKAANSEKGIWHVMWLQVMLYGALSGFFSILICYFGSEIINFLYHGKHINFLPVLYGWGIVSIFMSIIYPVESVVIIKKRLNKYNFIRLWIGILVCVLSAISIGLYGAMAAIILTGVAMVAALLSAFWVLRKI